MRWWLGAIHPFAQPGGFFFAPGVVQKSPDPYKIPDAYEWFNPDEGLSFRITGVTLYTSLSHHGQSFAIQMCFYLHFPLDLANIIQNVVGILAYFSFPPSKKIEGFRNFLCIFYGIFFKVEFPHFVFLFEIKQSNIYLRGIILKLCLLHESVLCLFVFPPTKSSKFFAAAVIFFCWI